MAYFGLTADLFCRGSGVLLKTFNSLDTTSVLNGEAIVNEALERNEALIRSFLPSRIEKLLSHIDLEYIETDATENQTALTLGSPATSGTVYLWVYGEDEAIESPRKADALTETAGNFALSGTGNKTVTLTAANALSAGDIVIASYDTTLGDDCPSLQRILMDMTRYDLLMDKLPENRDRYEAAYDKAIAFLNGVNSGKATIREIAKLDLVDETEDDDDGAIIYVRRPA